MSVFGESSESRFTRRWVYAVRELFYNEWAVSKLGMRVLVDVCR